jgi:hypothetical protein
MSLFLSQDPGELNVGDRWPLELDGNGESIGEDEWEDEIISDVRLGSRRGGKSREVIGGRSGSGCDIDLLPQR